MTKTPKLSPAMIAAIRGAYAECGTVMDATSSTEAALIRRGLAFPVMGKTTRRVYGSRHAQTFYDAYLGARLTDEGRKVRAELHLAKDLPR